MLGAFCDKFFTRKEHLEEARALAVSFPALANTAKSCAGCPLGCRVDRSAYWYHDEAAQVVELLDSGIDPELGGKLVFAEELLLKALHSTDVKRSLRMLTVALGHGAVTCVVAVDKDDAAGVCRVVHLHVDVAEALWLPLLHKSRNADSQALPATSMLTMCFGQALQDPGRAPADEGLRFLQWYSPSCKVPMATEDGREVSQFIVFEMELDTKNVDGLRELPHKTFLMDGVEGRHYAVKMFRTEGVHFQQDVGLVCQAPELLLSWQLRRASAPKRARRSTPRGSGSLCRPTGWTPTTARGRSRFGLPSRSSLRRCVFNCAEPCAGRARCCCARCRRWRARAAWSFTARCRWRARGASTSGAPRCTTWRSSGRSRASSRTGRTQARQRLRARRLPHADPPAPRLRA